eukprot:scaffold1882_cov163-Ochromonas_danica.AAC.1
MALKAKNSSSSPLRTFWIRCLTSLSEDEQPEDPVGRIKHLLRHYSQPALIDKEPNSRLIVSQLYLQLGSLYQQEDLKRHTGGDLQRQALQAFDSALSTLNSTTSSTHHLLAKHTAYYPLYLQTVYHKGILLKMMSRGEDSIATFLSALAFLHEEKKALHLADRAALLYYLGDSYLLIGNLSAAIQVYHESLSLSPCKTERFFGYLQALREEGRWMPQEGWKEVASLLQERIDYCHPLHDVNETSLSSQTFEKGWATHSQRVQSHVGLTHLKATNQNTTISTIVTDLEQEEEEEEQEETYLDVYGEEVENSLFASPPPAFSQLPLILYPSLSLAHLPSKRADIHYSLAAILEKVGDYGRAFQALQTGNAIERQHRIAEGSFTFQREDTVQQFKNTELVFHADFWRPLLLDESSPAVQEIDQVGSANTTTIQPIFIIGMMRSGSTLLESMLASHPAIAGIGEESLFNSQLQALRDELVRASNLQPPSLARQSSQEVIAHFRRKINRLLYKKAQSQFKSKAAQPSRRIFVVDKMLFNYRNIGFIHLIYPKAAILHIHRDPMDCLMSVFKHKFDDQGLGWSLDLQDILFVYGLYLQYMHHFRSRLPPGRILDIRYEDLAKDPARMMKIILEEHLHLPYDEQVLHFYNQKRAVLTHSQS